MTKHSVVAHVAGSTTAEGACESVRLACEQLVANTLIPTAEDMQEEDEKQASAEATWKALLKQACNPMVFPNRQLTAYALFDGSRRDKPAGEHRLDSNALSSMVPPAVHTCFWSPYRHTETCCFLIVAVTLHFPKSSAAKHASHDSDGHSIECCCCFQPILGIISKASDTRVLSKLL